MPSEFDSLVLDLATGQTINRLRPDQRRLIEEQIAEMARPVTTRSPMEDADRNGVPDDKEIQAAAAEGRRRSDADALIRDGINSREAQRRSSATLSKALREMQDAASKSAAALTETRAMYRSMQRHGVRERTRDVLAKALSSFHAGNLTSHQVATIEARAHRVMALAAEVGR